MKKMLAVLPIVLCLFVSWTSVGADVINFQTLPDSAGSTPFSLYQEGGYSLTNNTDIVFGDPNDPLPPTPGTFGWWGINSAGFAGSKALFNNYWPSIPPGLITATLTKDDNTPFSMFSIDLSKLNPSNAGGSVTFTGIKYADNSTVTQTFTYSNALAFQTFSFSSDFDDLKSLSWIPVSDVEQFQFDNITMTPVPIPGAIWLLGSGLFGLMAIRRRMKK